MIAEQLQEMLKTMELDKVRVTELCRRCGITTQLFYYHFRDKYELVAWVFLYDCAGRPNESIPGHSYDSFYTVFERVERRKAFYRKVFRDTSQNSIVWYIQKFNVHISVESFKRANNGQAPSNEQMLEILYFSYGMIGTFLHWLYGELDVTASDVARFHYEKAPEFLRSALLKYSFSRDEVLAMSTIQLRTAEGY